MLPFNKLCFIL